MKNRSTEIEKSFGWELFTALRNERTMKDAWNILQLIISKLWETYHATWRMKDVFGKSLGGGVFGAATEETRVVFFFGLNAVRLLAEYRKSWKKNIPNPNSTILFVGFSTEGSLAALLKDSKRKSVTIDQKEYSCKCACYSLKSLSGHAPFWQLVENYSSINCQKIVLHHSSKAAKEKLKEVLDKELQKQCKSTRVVISNSGLKFTL